MLHYKCFILWSFFQRWLFLLFGISQALIHLHGNIINDEELKDLFDNIHERRAHDKDKDEESDLEKALESTINLNLHFKNPHKIQTPGMYIF